MTSPDQISDGSKSRLFTVVSDDSLCWHIAHAKERLVIIAPGLSLQVADAFAKRVAADGGPKALTVVVDVDPEVCRLGYGDFESLKLVKGALDSRNLTLQMHEGLRIGVVIADAETVVFTPTPRLIEAGSTAEKKPNAIHIPGKVNADLFPICEVEGDGDPVLQQEVGLDTVSEQDIAKTKVALDEAPPRQFDLARLERVFNYRLEFVEFSVEHYKLNTRSVPLNPEILGLAESDLRERFRNTFRVFQAGSPFRFQVENPTNPKRHFELTEKWLSNRADQLRKEYFIPLGSATYGSLIQKRLKPEFEDKVAQLRTLVDLYAQKVREAIGAKIAETRNGLIAALFPQVKASPPKSWLRRSVDGKLSESTIRALLEDEVDRAFGKVEQTFKPTVTCLFKGVNYETITRDPHFREKIEGYFGPDEVRKLFDEHKSSRAQSMQTNLFSDK